MLLGFCVHPYQFWHMGKLNLIGAIVSVGVVSLIALLMYIAFEGSIKSNDFSIIAGYKKSDSSNLPRFATMLRTMSLIMGFNAVILNALYLPVYFIDSVMHMKVSLVFFAVSIIGLVATVFLVNHKYKL